MTRRNLKNKRRGISVNHAKEKMRKPTKSSLTRKLDEICSEIVRSRGYCVRCNSNKYEKLQCCHIYTRKWRSVRWDTLNLLCLCASCHAHFHDAPIELQEFARQYLGEPNYTKLKLRANTPKKWKLYEMEELYNGLKTTGGDL